jgi:hypothetical protein
VKATPRTCVFKDCDHPAKGRGDLCGGHREQQRRGKELMPLRSRRLPGSPFCSFEGCQNRHKANGLCYSHYRQQREGKQLNPLRRYSSGEACSLEGCENPHSANSLCDGHNQQRRAGSALRPLRQAKKRARCEFDGCPRPSRGVGGGLCSGHQQQKRLGKPLKALLPFKKKSDPMARDERGRKRCVTCAEWLPVEAFNQSKSGADRLAGHCRACTRWRLIEYKYGLTRAQYENMLTEQGYMCAGCRVTPIGGPSEDVRATHIDHDHSCCPTERTCGECTRALLCRGCNTALGYLKESPVRARNLAAYIEGWKETR